MLMEWEEWGRLAGAAPESYFSMGAPIRLPHSVQEPS